VPEHAALAQPDTEHNLRQSGRTHQVNSRDRVVGTHRAPTRSKASGFITLGQSLTWTFIEDHTVSGYGDDPNGTLAQTGPYPGNASTCQLMQWYTGQ